jgi:A/G-specific adenine glycosylase
MTNVFKKILLAWYQSNAIPHPWKSTKDPYRVWLSEVILQQTKVQTGTAYYQRFIDRFPDVYALAEAPEEEVLKSWEGLGYYSRARNLHEAAKHITNNLNGQFPDSSDDWKKLKGVGSYTAAAIASFTMDEPIAVVDGNVYRVLSRILGIHTPIDSTEGKKEFNILANKLLDVNEPAVYNQAIMDFGASCCKPRLPDCENCPFAEYCEALKQGLVTELPVKAGKTKVRKRYFDYLVFVDNERNTLIRKRINKDIWQGLYEFPLIEMEKKSGSKDFMNFKIKAIDVSEWKKHILSHQHIFYRLHRFEVKDLESIKEQFPTSTLVPLKELENYAFPRLLHWYFTELLYL